MTKLNATAITDEIPIRKLLISNSSTNIKCARKFEFYKLYPKIKQEGEDYHTDIGHALHKAYQDYLIHRDKDRAIWILIKNYPYEAIKPRHDPKSLEACYAALLAMLSHEMTYTHELVFLNIGDKKDVPSTELAFEIQLSNINFGDSDHPISVSYIGYIDLLLRNRVQGSYNVTDIKTHKRNLLDMMPLYQFDNQITPYGIVLEHLLGKEVTDIEGSYLSVYIDLVEPRVTKYPVQKSGEDIVDWLFHLRNWLNNYQFYFNNNWFPRSGGENCMSFNQKCDYMPVCSLRDRGKITKLLTMEREDITWEPQPFEPDLIFQLEVPEYDQVK